VLTLEFLTTSEDQGWERCKFAPLACAKCDQILGRFYKDTPDARSSPQTVRIGKMCAMPEASLVSMS